MKRRGLFVVSDQELDGKTGNKEETMTLKLILEKQLFVMRLD